MPLRLAGEELDDIRVRLYGSDGTPLLLGGPSGDRLEVVATNPDGSTIGGAGGSSHTDDAPFTPATDSGTVAFALAGETSPDSVDDGDAGAVRMSTDRILYLRNHLDEDVTLLASALRTGDVNSADQTNLHARGVVLFFNVTARTVGASPIFRMRIQAKDPLSGGYQYLGQFFNGDPIIGLRVFVWYPGITEIPLTLGPTDAFGLPLPKTWRLATQFGADITNLTYSVAISYIY